MRYRCTACDRVFEAEEGRCPTCLRQSTVLPADGQARAGGGEGGGPGRPGAGLGAFGLVVAIAVITPFMVMNWIHWHLGWWFTFVVALVGFGLGHLVHHLAHTRKT
ncbi:MAG TPA: hypothetical protein PK668_06860 [Myxococcota bacterium]|nr:hypothetical protein [Myxococcota bacterium]HRY92436.1 hypothetical protein [Myxococcota bacterium]HSA22984.1 hypothetical protein [Myxococcota bacterium]